MSLFYIELVQISQYVLFIQTIRHNTDQCMTVSRSRVYVTTSVSSAYE